jgi:uncharacterized membrane protein YjgN (DUF898 family)
MDSDQNWAPPETNSRPPLKMAPPQAVDDAATTILVLSILSLVMCQLLGPVAWFMGSQYLARCDNEGVPPHQFAVAGRVLGMVGTALFCLQLTVVALYLIVVVIAILA